MILRIFVLICCVGAVGGALLLAGRVDNNTTKPMKIETVGLDELGIRVEAPYGPRSPNHALIVNNTSHTLIACDVVFEYTKDDGTVLPAHKTIIFGDVVSAPADQRSAVLKNNPCIAPRSKMLIGLGTETDMVPISDRLPALGTSAVEATRNDRISFPKLTIKLNAVMLEDGSIVGPLGEQFREKIKQALAEDKNRE
jgi:hypothetical protein